MVPTPFLAWLKLHYRQLLPPCPALPHSLPLCLSSLLPACLPACSPAFVPSGWPQAAGCWLVGWLLVAARGPAAAPAAAGCRLLAAGCCSPRPGPAGPGLGAAHRLGTLPLPPLEPVLLLPNNECL